MRLLRTTVLVLCFAFCVVVAFNALYVIPKLSAASSRNAEARVALCALRADLERRVAASERFLAEHPEGLPGIPPRTIREGIDNQSRTIAALSDLDCPKD